MLLMISPPLPIMDPTSLPLMIRRMVKVTLGVSLGNGLSMSDDDMVKDRFNRVTDQEVIRQVGLEVGSLDIFSFGT